MKMIIYLVISNGDVNGEVDGAYFKYGDAKAKFDEIKQNWLDYAKDSNYDYEDEDDYFSITNFDTDEFMEVRIEDLLVE